MKYGVEVADAQVRATLAQLRSTVSDLSPIMRSVAAVLLDCIEENFAQQGRPQRWADLRPSTIAAKRADGYSARILQRTGALLNSLVQASDSSSAQAGVSSARGADRYAAAQNFGSKPHVIAARNKKFLHWGGKPGRFAKKVNHPGLPPRPFLVLTDDARDEVVKVVQRALQRNLASSAPEASKRARTKSGVRTPEEMACARFHAGLTQRRGIPEGESGCDFRVVSDCWRFPGNVGLVEVEDLRA